VDSRDFVKVRDLLSELLRKANQDAHGKLYVAKKSEYIDDNDGELVLLVNVVAMTIIPRLVELESENDRLHKRVDILLGRRSNYGIGRSDV